MHLFLLIGECQREASSVRAMVRSRLRVCQELWLQEGRGQPQAGQSACLGFQRVPWLLEGG